VLALLVLAAAPLGRRPGRERKTRAGEPRRRWRARAEATGKGRAHELLNSNGGALRQYASYLRHRWVLAQRVEKGIQHGREEKYKQGKEEVARCAKSSDPVRSYR
jgi:hypothetical protein